MALPRESEAASPTTIELHPDLKRAIADSGFSLRVAANAALLYFVNNPEQRSDMVSAMMAYSREVVG